MARKFTQIGISVASLVLFWNCAGTADSSTWANNKNIPAWAMTSEHPRYPKTLFWTGVGSASDLTGAADEARAEVAAQIKVQIKSVTSSTESELMEHDRAYYHSAFESSVQALVDHTIQGIEIIESQKTGSEFYAFAVLNKSTYLSSLERELQDFSDQLSTLYSDAERLLDIGDIFPAIENLADALQLVPEVYPRQNFYNALSAFNFNLPPHLQGAALLSHIRSVLSAVNLTLVSGENQTGHPGRRLPKPVIISCELTRSGRAVPISSMPIRAVYASGDQAGKASTDVNGLAELKLSAVPGERPDQGSVRITLNLGRMPEIMGPELKTLELLVNYQIVGQVASFAVAIKSADGSKATRVEAAIEETILAAGFRIDPNSKLVIEGVVSEPVIREIELGGLPTYQAEASLRLVVIDRSTGSNMGSMEVSKKMVHKDRTTASVKASEQVGRMVKRKALAQMLADALSK